MKFEIHTLDETHCMATCWLLSVGVWRKSIPASVLRLQARLQKNQLTKNPKLGIFNVVEKHCAPPDPEARAVIEKAARENKGHVRVANVVESDGVTGALLRTVMRTFSLTVGRESRAAVFANVEEALRWMLKELSGETQDGTPAPTQAELVELIDHMRAQIDGKTR